METVYDWVSVAIFAGLAVVFLQRSIGARPANDRIINYLPPTIGCAVANYLGNHDYGIIAAVLLAAVVVYTWIVIRPGRSGTGNGI